MHPPLEPQSSREKDFSNRVCPPCADLVPDLSTTIPRKIAQQQLEEKCSSLAEKLGELKAQIPLDSNKVNVFERRLAKDLWTLRRLTPDNTAFSKFENDLHNYEMTTRLECIEQQVTSLAMNIGEKLGRVRHEETIGRLEERLTRYISEQTPNLRALGCSPEILTELAQKAEKNAVEKKAEADLLAQQILPHFSPVANFKRRMFRKIFGDRGVRDPLFDALANTPSDVLRHLPRSYWERSGKSLVNLISEEYHSLAQSRTTALLESNYLQALADSLALALRSKNPYTETFEVLGSIHGDSRKEVINLLLTTRGKELFGVRRQEYFFQDLLSGMKLTAQERFVLSELAAGNDAVSIVCGIRREIQSGKGERANRTIVNLLVDARDSLPGSSVEERLSLLDEAIKTSQISANSLKDYLARYMLRGELKDIALSLCELDGEQSRLLLLSYGLKKRDMACVAEGVRNLTPKRREQIFSRYEELYGVHPSGELKNYPFWARRAYQVALSLLDDSRISKAEQLRLFILGPGANVEGILKLYGKSSREEIAQFEAEYSRLHSLDERSVTYRFYRMLPKFLKRIVKTGDLDHDFNSELFLTVDQRFEIALARSGKAENIEEKWQQLNKRRDYYRPGTFIRFLHSCFRVAPLSRYRSIVPYFRAEENFSRLEGVYDELRKKDTPRLRNTFEALSRMVESDINLIRDMRTAFSPFVVELPASLALGKTLLLLAKIGSVSALSAFAIGLTVFVVTDFTLRRVIFGAQMNFREGFFSIAKSSATIGPFVAVRASRALFLLSSGRAALGARASKKIIQSASTTSLKKVIKLAEKRIRRDEDLSFLKAKGDGGMLYPSRSPVGISLLVEHWKKQQQGKRLS